MKKVLAVIMSLSPALAFAQVGNSAPLGQLNNANDVITRLLSFGDVVIYLLVALAVIYIVYNVVNYIIKGAGEEKTKALANVGWGILGLAIIVSIWGLVNILVNSFKTNPTRQPIPNVGNNVYTGGQPGNQVPQLQ